MLRNSLIPVVTAAGPLLGSIITGSFIIETIFAIPGIGRYYVTAVSARDYSVMMGLTVLLARSSSSRTSSSTSSTASSTRARGRRAA